ncbi:hypothetical protein GW916_09975 [bacterium]|nr:hypothetical protein [bacterium]
MASNMGPLAAVKAIVSTEHLGVMGELGDTQAFLETQNGELYIVDYASKTSLMRAMEVSAGGSIQTWVYLAEIIREDARLFFAFNSLHERDIFVALTQVKDVGPKTAAVIVAELGAENIMRLMQQGVWKGLKIAGVGPKTWDSIVFGLNKKKNSLLPLLTRVQSSPENSVPSTKTSTTAKLSGDMATTSADFIAESKAWKPSLFASDALITMFEGLGLNPTQTNQLFSECSKEVENFQELSDPEKVPEMLKVHGRNRRHAPHAKF